MILYQDINPFIFLLRIFSYQYETKEQVRALREREWNGENIFGLQTFPVTYFRVTKLNF